MYVQSAIVCALAAPGFTVDSFMRSQSSLLVQDCRPWGSRNQ